MWKAILFILVSGAIITMGLYTITRVPFAVINQKEPLPLEINYEERVQSENNGVPSYIQIPSMYLYADAEHVAVDGEQRLTKPKDIMNVGWYSRENIRLGTPGVIVFAGDFDRADGMPGLFYNLNALEKDDIISVTDLNGKKFNYTVYDKAIYSWDTTDVSTLLLNSQNPRLNIIIYPAHSQDHRALDESKTIIYAEMK